MNSNQPESPDYAVLVYANRCLSSILQSSKAAVESDHWLADHEGSVKQIAARMRDLANELDSLIGLPSDKAAVQHGIRWYRARGYCPSVQSCKPLLNDLYRLVNRATRIGGRA